MATLREVKEAIRNPYAWPGGYPLFLLMGDGEAMSVEAARQEFRQVARAHIDGNTRDQWYVAGVDVNWEDATLTCAHLGKPIECAYPPD